MINISVNMIILVEEHYTGAVEFQAFSKQGEKKQDPNSPWLTKGRIEK